MCTCITDSDESRTIFIKDYRHRTSHYCRLRLHLWTPHPKHECLIQRYKTSIFRIQLSSTEYNNQQQDERR